jgi:hypothetical protein
MNKISILIASLALAAATVHAEPSSALHDTDCPLISASELSKSIQKVGAAAGLALANDMALHAELRCSAIGKPLPGARYVYTFRAAIEKQLQDGEQQRWAPLAQLTGFGTARSSTFLRRQVEFTLRDLIRQEP